MKDLGRASLFAVLATCVATGSNLKAQEFRGDGEERSSEHALIPSPAPEAPLEPYAEAPSVILSLSAGWIGTTAVNDFPSLIVGNSTIGSGVIPSAYADFGSGYTIEFGGLIYFTNTVGMTFGFALTRYAAEYHGDTSLFPTKLEVQESEVLLGAHVDLYAVPTNIGPGIRSFYAEGGFEFGIGVMGNLVTSSGVVDTISDKRTEARGSFEGGEPFRNRVALRVGVGTIVDLSGDNSGSGLSLIAEAGYSYALNPVFSSEAVLDNSFKVNHLVLQAGLGYRF